MSDRSKSKDKLNLFADIAMRGLTASAFFVAGAIKLSFLLLHYALSDSIGAWQLVSFFLGLVEIVGSFFLMVPKFVASAALLLFGVSFGAVIAVAMLSASASVPIGDVLGLFGVVIWVSILNIGHEPFVFMEFQMKSTTVAYYADFIVYPALLGAAVLWTVPSRLRGMPLWLAFFFLGVFIWTLTEYVVHRYAFHRLPVLSQLHEAHHVEPREHLGTPFWVGALALAAVLVILVSAIGRSAGGGAGTGLIAGYLWYLCVHHAIHHWSALRFSYLRRARRSHSRHHFSLDECNFGVTTDFWDRVFRTYTATLWLSRGEAHSKVLSRAAHDDREPLMDAPVAAPEPSGLRRGHRLWRDHRPASQSRPRARDASARLCKTQPCASSPKD